MTIDTKTLDDLEHELETSTPDDELQADLEVLAASKLVQLDTDSGAWRLVDAFDEDVVTAGVRVLAARGGR